jgi:hypothetical protein
MFYIVCYIDEWKSYISKEYYEIINELVTKHNWKLLDPKEEPPEDAEIVLQWETYNIDWKGDHYKRWFFCDDIHYSNINKYNIKQNKFKDCDLILGPYVYNIETAGYNIECQYTWIPHCSSSVFLKDFNDTPLKHVLVPQPDIKTSLWYPLRTLISYNKENIKVINHPGYTHYPGMNIKSLNKYKFDPLLLSQEMNNSLITLTDMSIFNYLSAKHFEIPATGSLLLCEEKSTELFSSLGIYEYQHFLTFNELNFPLMINNIFKNFNIDHLNTIRKSLYQIINNNHTYINRAHQINDLSIIKSSFL